MIRTKENRKYLKNFKGCYAYSYVDEYGDPIDLNIVADTYLDDDGFVNGVTYCKIPAYRDWETDRKSTRLNSSHSAKSRMPSSA